MQNARLDESQAGIKIAGKNINNLIFGDDTTLMEESKDEPKNLLMKVKRGSEKAGLKLSIQKTNIKASSPIISWQIDGGKVETVTDFIFLVSKIAAATKLKVSCSLEKNYDQLRQHIKMQRRSFANKGLYSQSCGFSSTHVQM